MHDTSPRSHPVDCAGLDALHGPQAVAMHEGAFEKIGDRCQSDVRVGPDVMIVVGCDVERTEVIEEKEWSDGLPLRGRERAAYLKSPDVANARPELKNRHDQYGARYQRLWATDDDAEYLPGLTHFLEQP